MALTLPIEPISQEAFGAFGSVIEIGNRSGNEINDGRAMRYHRVAEIDAATDGGIPIISIFRTGPCERPVRLSLFERHPLGSQSFVPLARQRLVAVVGDFGDDGLTPDLICAFVTNGQQGVHYNAGTWHHPTMPGHGITRYSIYRWKKNFL